MGEAVVVVEHEEPTREFLSRQLADDGFEVFATDRAVAALALVEERRPDLVLLDAVLPDGYGKKSRATSSWAATKSHETGKRPSKQRFL